jgi:hypothetical protein
VQHAHVRQTRPTTPGGRRTRKPVHFRAPARVGPRETGVTSGLGRQESYCEALPGSSTIVWCLSVRTCSPTTGGGTKDSACSGMRTTALSCCARPSCCCVGCPRLRRWCSMWAAARACTRPGWRAGATACIWSTSSWSMFEPQLSTRW